MPGYGQQTTFDLNKIRFKGLRMEEPKEVVMKTFGKPKIKYPDYECGAYSKVQPGSAFYQLIYSGFNYIGRDKEKFILEELDFDVLGKTKLQYGDKVLSGLTTENEFVNLFGAKAKAQFTKQSENMIFLNATYRDDRGVFYFKKGKLIKFQYDSPC